MWALANQYLADDVVYSGPIVDSARVEDGAIFVKFQHVGEGLVKLREELTWFMIADEDGEFKQAIAGTRQICQLLI